MLSASLNKTFLSLSPPDLIKSHKLQCLNAEEEEEEDEEAEEKE